MEIQTLVFENNGSPVTSSVLVAAKFGKDHRHVLESVRNMTAENSALLSMFAEATYMSSQNKELPMYLINQDGFALLAMGFTGKKALNFKLEYINAFNNMKSMLNSDDYILERSQQILQGRLQQIRAQLNQAQTTIEQQAVKVEYHDKVLNTSSTHTTTLIAKELGMTAIALNRQLHELRVQFKQGKTWVLYAEHQDKEYTKPRTITINDDLSVMNTQWTEKGRQFIHSLISNNTAKSNT